VYGAVALLFGFALVAATQQTAPGRSIEETRYAGIQSDIDSLIIRETITSAKLASIPVLSPYKSSERIHPKTFSPVPPELIDEETLWLARCIFSESKRFEEQELVAWVVRNRVETGYRGKTSYRDTVLDPFQFSAFNKNSTKRAFYMGLTPTTELTGWNRTLWIAYHVRNGESNFRPFPLKTRHFYSARSMQEDQGPPAWTEGRAPVTPDRDYTIEDTRFRFFAGVS
jgi:hypothetical protein